MRFGEVLDTVMMELVFPALLVLIASGVGFRLWLRRWRERRVAARRRIEAPNSHYSSKGVRQQEDRERWGDIDLGVLHPINRDEVSRLLEIVDVDGVGILTRKERLFLDNMALPRLGS
jgi:hypothetical protein